MLEAMQAEWDKWQENKSVRVLTQTQLDWIIASEIPHQIVDTRWVLVRKVCGKLKARLVVIGCQEIANSLRHDAPKGSVLGFYLTIAFGAQPGWTLCSADASCAFLQSKGIERWLLLRMPKIHPPPGTVSEQIFLAMGSIYGTR